MKEIKPNQLYAKEGEGIVRAGQFDHAKGATEVTGFLVNPRII
jgi:hypothetical protein